LRLTEVRNRLLLAEVAIRAYMLEHRKLPQSLDALGLDPTLLIDPDSASRIIYKPQGRSYLLYGIGPDGKDDGGRPANEHDGAGSGDVGVRAFAPNKYDMTPEKQPESYRRVPHMLEPILPPGAPPLRP
jgi:hypothetical protein